MESVKQKKQPKGRKEEGRKKESGRTKKEKKEMDGEQRTGTASQSAAASAIVTCPPTLPNTVTPSSAARMTGANGNVVHNPQTQVSIHSVRYDNRFSSSYILVLINPSSRP